ncbi:vitamin B12-dependent ribonucleotide reductase [Candidatus Latescibacterota bacterium]
MSASITEKITIPSSTELIDSVDKKIPEESLRFSDNALTVLESRYLKKDDSGKVIEKPRDMFLRVAKVIAGAEDLMGSSGMTGRVEKLFYNMMAAGEFLPNSPTLMNAGRELGQLSACFVLPVEDSMDSIFQAVKDAAIIHKSGGGTGFSFSRLRPKNDVVRSTRGISSGPVSFMFVFDTATETIKQGGARRGANMGILRIDHPDIREFITSKRRLNRFTNFNISVAVTDAFMEAVKTKSTYNLINPRTGEISGTEKAHEIFDLIVENAHSCGDPGILFIDRINEKNTLPHLGRIESTNPCGEQPLLPYESCNLGSINLSRMITEQVGKPAIDWQRLGCVTHLAVRFLDDVIEVNKFPLARIAAETRRNRKIGLGVMGFADMLIRLGIPYDSEEGEKTAEQVMTFIDRESKTESRHLAELRGPFPSFDGSIYDKRGEPSLRNATTTTIAPTGTISIIASCSSGIEPLFALAYNRNVLENKRLAEFHPVFREMAEQVGILDKKLEKAVLETGSIAHTPGIPKPMKRIFRTANDITVEWHIRIQAAFQRHIDNAVSKTINFPASATVQDIAASYMRAYEAGLKGITIYRDGSRKKQVLTTEKSVKPEGRSKLKPRPRPQITTGQTEKLLTGCGNLYVTVNSDESGLCEVFCQMGRSGACTASQSEAISRLISLALRSGVNLNEIVSQLKGIRCPSPIWQNGKLILSCADGIATALARYIENRNSNTNTTQLPLFKQDADSLDLKELVAGKRLKGEMAGVCPDCGGVLEYAEGCKVCRVCGYSSCG